MQAMLCWVLAAPTRFMHDADIRSHTCRPRFRARCSFPSTSDLGPFHTSTWHTTLMVLLHTRNTVARSMVLVGLRGAK